MQSLSRQLRRGNAVIIFNAVTMGHEVVQKKGTPRKIWNHSKRNALSHVMDKYLQNVTKPIKRD